MNQLILWSVVWLIAIHSIIIILYLFSLIIFVRFLVILFQHLPLKPLSFYVQQSWWFYMVMFYYAAKLYLKIYNVRHHLQTNVYWDWGNLIPNCSSRCPNRATVSYRFCNMLYFYAASLTLITGPGVSFVLGGELSPGGWARGIRPSSQSNMPMKGNVCEDKLPTFGIKLASCLRSEVIDAFWVWKDPTPPVTLEFLWQLIRLNNPRAIVKYPKLHCNDTYPGHDIIDVFLCIPLLRWCVLFSWE